MTATSPEKSDEAVPPNRPRSSAKQRGAEQAELCIMRWKTGKSETLRSAVRTPLVAPAAVQYAKAPGEALRAQEMLALLLCWMSA